MEELCVPELTSEQIEELCSIAEEVVRECVLSKVSSKGIETLNVSVEAEGAKPVTLAIDVDIALSQLVKDFDVQKLVGEAVKEGFAVAEKHLRELACRSTK